MRTQNPLRHKMEAHLRPAERGRKIKNRIRINIVS